MTADPRARWAEQLATSAEATSDEAIAAFLRTLPNADFAPAPEQVAAVNTLAGSGLPVGPDSTVEQLLRDEVAAFATRYWTLMPTERRAAWSDLTRRGANPARLRELEPGLHLLITPLADPIAEELATLIRELFVLPPRERAIRRNTWLFARTAEESQWRDAFATVHREVPAFATLDPQLAVALSETHAQAALAQASSASRAASRERDAIKAGFEEFKYRMQDQERTKGRSSNQPSARGTSYGIFGALAIGLALVRVIGLIGSSTTTSTSITTPSYTPPVAPPMPAFKMHSPDFGKLPEETFSVAEVEEFEQYERDKKKGAIKPVPRRYLTWCLADRPAGVIGSRAPDPTEDVISGVTFDRVAIQKFQQYERAMTGRKPLFYEFWVKVGRPTKPGKYSITPSTP